VAYNIEFLHRIAFATVMFTSMQYILINWY